MTGYFFSRLWVWHSRERKTRKPSVIDQIVKWGRAFQKDKKNIDKSEEECENVRSVDGRRGRANGFKPQNDLKVLRQKKGSWFGGQTVRHLTTQIYKKNGEDGRGAREARAFVMIGARARNIHGKGKDISEITRVKKDAI